MDPNEVKRIIEAGLQGAVVECRGDGRHFEAVIVCPLFEGKSMLAQHRLVYATLGDRFDTDSLHALSIKTLTPAEAQATTTH